MHQKSDTHYFIKMERPQIIALYLPQFHPTDNNDKWWGKGFTEWTNVGKAKPLFKGHYQPKVPSDLGYYDLRLKEVRNEQAKLAKEAGISAFCYYHYWFGNGEEELEFPFNEVLRTKEPDFPFCLCWANESWHKKFWNDFNSSQKMMLREQTYPGDEDIIKHFYRLLPAFKDKRYFKVNGKNIFMIYKPFDIPDCKLFIRTWNKLALSEQLPEFFFIAQIQEKIDDDGIENLISNGFDAVNLVGLYHSTEDLFNSYSAPKKLFKRAVRFIRNRILSQPLVYNYAEISKFFNSRYITNENCVPTLIPNWDHTPRSGNKGLVFENSTPILFEHHVKDTINQISSKSNKLIFLKSWNEWGEGNYMEPDLKWGKGYIQSLRKVIDDYV